MAPYHIEMVLSVKYTFPLPICVDLHEEDALEQPIKTKQIAEPTWIVIHIWLKQPVITHSEISLIKPLCLRVAEKVLASWKAHARCWFWLRPERWPPRPDCGPHGGFSIPLTPSAPAAFYEAVKLFYIMFTPHNSSPPFCKSCLSL